jgi:hypothetical protein
MERIGPAPPGQQAPLRKNRIWLDQREKIASFHPLAGGVLREFPDARLFQRFLDELMEKGYRFQ